MERRLFGRTGLSVPAVGVGTWQTFDVWGAAADAPRSVVDAAFNEGATMFDSSFMYGEAERVLGRALAGRRERAIVATKVWTPDDAEAVRQVEAALRYFGGRVDVYQVHNLVAWRRRVEQLERLKMRGAVNVIGATHYSAHAFGELRRVMDDPRVAAVQDLGMGVIIMRPFGQGGLVRRFPSSDALAPLRPFGVSTWPQALLKWILSDRRCHVAIPATSNPAHMHENAAAGNPPWFGPEERTYVTKLANHL
jgi:aryl-alcohol dehydrogenase-like predicted oxidoreductase